MVADLFGKDYNGFGQGTDYRLVGEVFRSVPTSQPMRNQIRFCQNSVAVIFTAEL